MAKSLQTWWPLLVFALVAWWAMDHVLFSVARLEDKVEAQISTSRRLVESVGDEDMSSICEGVVGKDCVTREVCTTKRDDESHAEWLARHDAAVAAVKEKYGEKPQ